MSTEGSGIYYEAPPGTAQSFDRIVKADRPGEHLWIIGAVFHIADPERPRYQMDAENLLTIQGPGCFKCERTYSRKLAKMRCTGSLDRE